MNINSDAAQTNLIISLKLHSSIFIFVIIIHSPLKNTSHSNIILSRILVEDQTS